MATRLAGTSTAARATAPRSGYCLVGFALWVAMLATTLRTPTFQGRVGVSESTVTEVFAVYAVSVLGETNNAAALSVMFRRIGTDNRTGRWGTLKRQSTS